MMNFQQRFSVYFLINLFVLTSCISVTRARESNDTTKPLIIKMATLVPNGSPWHDILMEMAAQWQEVSKGRINLRIYPGGVAGDEADMIRKMRIGQLHAAAVSNGGLSRIAPDVNVLAIPMATDSWEALDRVRQAMAPRIEALLQEKGFVVLNWGDGGWVRFFVPTSDPSVDAIRESAKLFVMSGDARTEEIWKTSGFKVVPLSTTDVLTGLQTGMINAYSTTPIMALSSQWFAFTPYMIDMPWAPLVGATIISKKVWDEIPQSLRLELKQIAEKTGKRLQSEIRRMEDEAIAAMKKRGLKIITPTADQVKQWRQVMQNAYPKIRGEMIPEDWFDHALKVAQDESTSDGQ